TVDEHSWPGQKAEITTVLKREHAAAPRRPPRLNQDHRGPSSSHHSSPLASTLSTEEVPRDPHEELAAIGPERE
ncbi:MAG: hypothetical protein ABW003_27645, partial [Microvirga sp.]